MLGRFIAKRLYAQSPVTGYYSIDEVWKFQYLLSFSVPSHHINYSYVVSAPLSYDDFVLHVPAQLLVPYDGVNYLLHRVLTPRNRLRRRLVLRDEPAARGEHNF